MVQLCFVPLSETLLSERATKSCYLKNCFSGLFTLCVFTQITVNYVLKRERGWWVVDSWYFSLCSGFLPVAVVEDVYSRTLLTCSDSLESASCPSVAPPTSIFWKLAEETGHLCKKVVLMLLLMWLNKVFIPTVELFNIFCCPSYLGLSILHIT